MDRYREVGNFTISPLYQRLICLKVGIYLQKKTKKTIAFEMKKHRKQQLNIDETIEIFVKGISPPYVGNITAQTGGKTHREQREKKL